MGMGTHCIRVFGLSCCRRPARSGMRASVPLHPFVHANTTHAMQPAPHLQRLQPGDALALEVQDVVELGGCRVPVAGACGMAWRSPACTRTHARACFRGPLARGRDKYVSHPQHHHATHRFCSRHSFLSDAGVSWNPMALLRCHDATARCRPRWPAAACSCCPRVSSLMLCAWYMHRSYQPSCDHQGSVGEGQQRGQGIERLRP